MKLNCTNSLQREEKRDVFKVLSSLQEKDGMQKEVFKLKKMWEYT